MKERVRSVATMECRRCKKQYEKGYLCGAFETADFGKLTEPHHCEPWPDTHIMGIAEMVSVRLLPLTEASDAI